LHVKPHLGSKIHQLQPHQHLASQRKVAISYVPFCKIELDNKTKPRHSGLRSFKTKNKTRNSFDWTNLPVTPMDAKIWQHQFLHIIANKYFDGVTPSGGVSPGM
jgi:hypothetical protein